MRWIVPSVAMAAAMPLAVVLPATGASAQSLLYDRDPWSGVYVGATAGSGLGIFAGRNLKLGNFIIGIESEAKSGSMSRFVLAPTSPAVADINWMLSGRARAGFLAMPSLFVYGMAGVGAADFNFRDGATGALSRDTLAGLQLGLGAEWKLMDQVSLRIDYVHTDLSKYAIGSTGGVHNVDPSLDTLQVGVTFRF